MKVDYFCYPTTSKPSSLLQSPEALPGFYSFMCANSKIPMQRRLYITFTFYGT